MKHMLISKLLELFSMKKLFALGFSLMVGCDMGFSGSPQEKEFTHANGLQFKVSEPFADVQETDQGYIIYLVPKDTRQANQIAIQYRIEKPDDLERVKEIQGQRIHYREHSVDEGSGGSEMTLELWKKTEQGKGVYVEHYRQSEEKTDFAATWELIASAQ